MLSTLQYKTSCGHMTCHATCIRTFVYQSFLPLQWCHQSLGLGTGLFSYSRAAVCCAVFNLCKQKRESRSRTAAAAFTAIDRKQLELGRLATMIYMGIFCMYPCPLTTVPPPLALPAALNKGGMPVPSTSAAILFLVLEPTGQRGMPRMLWVSAECLTPFRLSS